MKGPNTRAGLKFYSMNQFVQQLYESMLEELQYCKQKELVWIEEIECCFQISVRYWSQLRERVIHYEFATEEEEIAFFKVEKPLFTSRIEYFNLLYHAELFEPDFGTESCKKFWQREAQRFEKFKEENHAFYIYYKRGHSSKDASYFTRVHNGLRTIAEATVYDMEQRTVSSHDHLVATIMALEKYHQYVKQQLKKAM